MIAVAYYLLKVTLCSGVLYAYYHLALRDKLFHQWNRFYLLGSMVLSIGLPLLQISFTPPAQHDNKIYTALEIVRGADEYVREVSARPSPWLNSELIPVLAYALVSGFTLVLFLVALSRIRRVIRRHQQVAIDDFYFLNTDEPGTPFSHFRFLLWNREIPLDSDHGQRILAHELVHIREKHSRDKLFVQLVLVVFWINPFFWLIRRELSMVHEFIADRKTVGSGDAPALARLLLETSFPGYAPMITNSFFTSSIKRRLMMITKEQRPALNYLSRLMMIPVLLVLLFTFGVKARTMLNSATTSTPLDKKYTVVIDAGHGGTDAGIQQGEANEKSLTLAIAQLVRQLNDNPNLNIILSRENDVLQPIREKVDFTRNNKADLFISVHINGSPDAAKTGIEAFIASKNENIFPSQNQRIATMMLKNLQTVYATDHSIKKRDQGIFVLDRNVCPSVMVEMGYLTNNADYNFITNKANQEKLARQVLKSIEDYFNPSMLVLTSPVSQNTRDTLPGKAKTSAGSASVHGSKITITSDSVHIGHAEGSRFGKSLPDDVNYTIDGKPSYRAAVDQLKPDEIHSMYVWKGQSATDKGKIDILTKAGVAADPTLVKKTNAAQSTTPSITIGQVAPVLSTTVNTNTSISVTTNTDTRVTTEPVVVSLTGVNANTGQSQKKLLTRRDPNTPKPLYIVNGEEMKEEDLNSIDQENIAEIRVLKGDDAKKGYGSKGENGVIIIKLKK